MQNKEDQILQATSHLSDRLFDEKRTYTYLKGYLMGKGLHQSLQALPYMKNLHEGQVRAGKDHIPYYSHPMQLASHAIALGLDEDELIAAALLHDVCEDCGVSSEELPVSESVRHSVALLTKPPLDKPSPDASETEWAQYHARKQSMNHCYYEALRTDRVASIVKLLDRCNNISGMAVAWQDAKLAEYIIETEEFIYPLMDYVRNRYPDQNNQIFLIKYHMRSVIEAIRHIIARNHC